MTQMDQDLEHLRLLSIFHYVVGGLMAFFACIPIIHVVIGVLMLAGAFGPGHGGPPPAVGILFVVIGGGIVLAGWTLAGLVIFAGRCLAQHRKHTFCLVIAGICCLFMPLGTVLGVFTIIVLMRPTVKGLFQ